MKLPPFLKDIPLIFVTVFALFASSVFSFTRTRNAEATMQNSAMPPLNRQEAARHPEQGNGTAVQRQIQPPGRSGHLHLPAVRHAALQQ